MISVRSSLRFFMLAVVSTLLLALAVGGVSAAPADFSPIHPGSAVSPGPVLNVITDVKPIEWEEAVGTGPVAYVWNVKINGGEPLSIPVPEAQIVVNGGTVNWEPGQLESLQILGAIVDGTYEWYVEATDDNGTTTSSSFYFQVDLPDAPVPPGEFDLWLPSNYALFRVLPNVVALTWKPSANAEGYILHLLQISNNTRLGPIGTLEIHPIEAECDEPTAETVCTIPVNFNTVNDGEPLTNGQYAWTVVAVNLDGEVEASNGPFLFTVNLEPIEMVSNGGFEDAAAPKSKNATGWQRVNPTGERRDCREAKLPTNVSGLCAYRATGGAAASVLTQKLPKAVVNTLGMGELDTLTVSALVQAAAAPTNASIRVIIKFTAGPKQVASIPLASVTTGTDFVPVTDTIDVDDGKGFVKAVVFKIISGTGGVFYVDDLSVKLNPVSLPLASAIPLPAAP